MRVHKKAIWISFDLGIKGDYSGLYTWLDNKNAVECGNGLAYINLDVSQYPTKASTQELIEHVQQDLLDNIAIAKSDRLYIIWKDNSTNKVKGEFITGSRKQAPWEGYGGSNKRNVIDTSE